MAANSREMAFLCAWQNPFFLSLRIPLSWVRQHQEGKLSKCPAKDPSMSRIVSSAFYKALSNFAATGRK